MKEAIKAVKESIHSFFEDDRTDAPPVVPDALGSMVDGQSTELSNKDECAQPSVVEDSPHEDERMEPVDIFHNIDAEEDEDIIDVLNRDIVGSLDDVAANLTALVSVMEDFGQDIASIKETMSESNAQAETLRMMSSRVKAYEEDFVSKSILRPIMRDFIHLHDSVTKACQWFSNCDEEQDWRTAASDALAGIQSELCETMHRHGLSAMQDTGDLLDPSIHKVVGVIRKEAVRDGEIAELVRIGWLWNGHVARHAEVKVNRYITTKEV